MHKRVCVCVCVCVCVFACVCWRIARSVSDPAPWTCALTVRSLRQNELLSQSSWVTPGKNVSFSNLSAVAKSLLMCGKEKTTQAISLNLEEWHLKLTFPSVTPSSCSTPSAAPPAAASPPAPASEAGCCTGGERTASPALSPRPRARPWRSPGAAKRSSWRAAGWRDHRAWGGWGCCPDRTGRSGPTSAPRSAAWAGGWSRGQRRRWLWGSRLRTGGPASSSRHREGRNTLKKLKKSPDYARRITCRLPPVSHTAQARGKAVWGCGPSLSVSLSLLYLCVSVCSFQPHFSSSSSSSSSSFLGSDRRESRAENERVFATVTDSLAASRDLLLRGRDSARVCVCVC